MYTVCIPIIYVASYKTLTETLIYKIVWNISYNKDAYRMILAGRCIGLFTSKLHLSRWSILFSKKKPKRKTKHLSAISQMEDGTRSIHAPTMQLSRKLPTALYINVML